MNKRGKEKDRKEKDEICGKRYFVRSVHNLFIYQEKGLLSIIHQAVCFSGRKPGQAKGIIV